MADSQSQDSLQSLPEDSGVSQSTLYCIEVADAAAELSVHHYVGFCYIWGIRHNHGITISLEPGKVINIAKDSLMVAQCQKLWHERDGTSVRWRLTEWAYSVQGAMRLQPLNHLRMKAEMVQIVYIIENM